MATDPRTLAFSAAPSAGPAKPFDCHRCGRNFARSEHLQRHERSHTKEKPFHCHLCPKAFTRKSVLHWQTADYGNSRQYRDLLRRHHRISHHPPDGHEASPASATQPARSTAQPSPLRPGGWSAAESSTVLDGIALPDPLEAALESLGAANARPRQDFRNGSPAARPRNGPMQPATAFLPDDLDFMPDDFSSFLDSIPQNMSQPFQSDYPLFPVLDLNGFSTDSINRTQDPSSETLPAPAERQGRRGNQGRAEVFTSYDKSEFDLSRFGSRLPSLEPEEEPVKPEPKTKSTTTVTSACREEVLRKLKLFSHVVSRSFILPSRHALSRFIFGYFTGFHEHYPMVHVPSFQLEEIPVDLFLAVAALGAQYCREPEQGLKLLRVAKAITLEKVHHQGPTGPDRKVTGQTQTSPCMSQCSGRPGTAVDISSYDNENDKPVCSLQCLILYVATATWFEDSVIAREAFSVLSLLDFLIREEGLKAPVHDEPASWESWIDAEMMKRTKLLGFCFFNLYTVLFNLPPLILSTEIELTLPSTEQEWRAKSAAEWTSLRTTQPGFQAALRGLFEDSSPSARYSSLGGYVLIHAIMQNIWLLQHTSKLLPRSAPPTLPAADVASFERALKAWCANWSQDHASSLDPISPHGPVPFNATALLRLAHIRISTPADAVQSLRSWDAARIARSLHAGGQSSSSTLAADRCPRLTRAALHCAHALSVPVKLGINFVAHTQALYWSNQHALCALESAGLLARWLRVVAAVPAAALASEERRLLDFVLQMVAETQGGGGEESQRLLLAAPARLSAVVVRLWAKLFRSDSVWEMVGLVGRVLEAYADLLEADAA